MTKASRSQTLLAREAMLATLSHEIRTPLNGVLGMAGLLADTRLDAAQTAYLKTLRECGEHLLGLVNDALDYAKLEAGRVELEPVATDVESLLQGVCELLSPRAHASNIEIAWAGIGVTPKVLADDGRLRQILFNLAGNAVKMTKTGGVTLTVEEISQAMGQTRLRFVVTDTGPGLSNGDQARIFEEFVQTRAGEAAGGAGLGLAIVQRLVHAFDGEVGVRSHPGEGAAFWFEATFDVVSPRLTAGFTPADIPTPLPLAHKVIAVISPSPVVRRAAVLQIEAAGGTGIECAVVADIPPNAVAALIDGQGFAPRARPKPAKGLPTLILLAPEERRRIAAARAAGFAGYLIKPLRQSSVVARLCAVLGEEAARAFVIGHEDPARFGEDERAAPPPVGGMRVLLAEDNPVNALLARAILNQSGCVVDRATSGEEAVAAALLTPGRTPYDLILMDLRMPDLDGLSATRALRKAGVATPIVALTANAFDEDRRACLEAGMNDFLTKPLDHRALNAVLARWASSASLREVAAS